MPQVHIAHRVEASELVNNPDRVLQRMSFKIFEKREAVLQGLVNTKIQFKTSAGVDQGICQSVNSQYCHVKVGSQNIRVATKKIILL